jgi:CheY-like chemotaxis protein
LLDTLESLAPVSSALRVLAVDDEEATRFIIREMIGTRFEVIEATSGHEALTKVREVRPDVILLDIRLVDMTGFDVYDQLRREPSHANIPVVMVTSQPVSGADRMRLGGTTVLSKALLTRDALLAAIYDASRARVD